MRSFDLAKSLFLQALDLPPGERAAFVDSECAGDDTLRADVESLLRFHDETLAGISAGHEPMPATVAGYVIERELGRGGMGVVYLARDAGGNVVAVKVLRHGLLSPALLARFRREAEVLSRLDHPGIARLIATGVEETPAGTRPWLAMEYVEGVDLRAWARRDARPAERLELMARVCDAVEHAHRAGVVHRDLKPENVLIRPDGSPVVLDFGVARLADSDVRATTMMTNVGELVGTIRYMSPEQAEGRAAAIGPASDVHALGVITYELLTGRLPFEVPENSVHRALVAVLTAPPSAMPELLAPLRSPLERVLRGALVKDSARRTASAAALGADLRRVATGRRPLARPPRTTPWHRDNVGAWLGLASGAVLVGLVLSAWRTPPTPADWIRGLLAPRAMFREITADVDSAAVRLHYTTRTLPREREAMVWARRGRELARTVGWQPWGDPLERLARFREGEAVYLVAGRTDDVAMYVRAAELWRSSCDPRFPRAPTPLPDTLSLSADELITVPPLAPWTSASMAFDDGARLADGDRLYPRALEMAREGRQALDRARRLLLPGAPGGPDSLETGVEGARRLALDALESSVEVRLGVALAGCALESANRGPLVEARVHLRRAVELAGESGNPPFMSSHLHELGVCEARMAAIGGDKSALDSAFVHLGRSYAIQLSLGGPGSGLLTRLELAQAHRLAARLDSPAAMKAHLAAAESLLDLSAGESSALGRLDRGLYESAGAGLAVDLCCARRDTSALPAAVAHASAALAAFGPRNAPQLSAAVHLEHARIQALRWALGGSLRARQGAVQSGDFANLLLRSGNTGSRLMDRRVALAGALLAPPRPYVLDWPLPEPY